jgi:hypothetical protein
MRTKTTLKVLQTLKPGQPGTKKPVSRFGERLLCVRYRADAARGVRYTTVEMIVDEAPLAARGGRPRKPSTAADPNPMVGVRIFFRESDVRERAKAAGAIWRPRQKLWEMPWRTASSLDLVDRVVSGRPRS